MPTDPSITARDIVDELALLDESFAQDRDLAVRVVETMLADRPEAVLRPGFRQELRSRLLVAASAPARRSVSGLSRLRSFFVGSGVGTAIGAVAAYAFLVFVAPVSPDIVAPVVRDGDVRRGTVVTDTGASSAEDASMSMMTTGTVSVAESVSDAGAPTPVEAPPADTAAEPAASRPDSRPQSGGGTDTASAPVPETVSNSVRNSASDVASSPERAAAPATTDSAEPSRALSAEKSTTTPSSEDAFSLSDIFSPIPDQSVSSSIMADSVPGSAGLAPDPANYTVDVSSGAVASLSELPASARSYASESADVAVPRSLSPALSPSARLSLRFMTATDDSPYGLTYSVDTVGGSIFASKNETAWPASAPAAETVSDDRIVAAADAVVRPIRAGIMKFGSGAVLPDVAGSDTVTVRYGVLAEGTDVYESYGMPREATVSYDRPAGRISGFALPRVTGFARTADAYSPPSAEIMRTHVRHELAGRGYVAGRYRIDSVRYVLAPEPAKTSGVAAGKETLVPSVLLGVVSDAGIRESFVMPFGR